MGLKISKRCVSYHYDSFSAKLFLNVPCDNPQNICLLGLEISNITLKKKNIFTWYSKSQFPLKPLIVERNGWKFGPWGCICCLGDVYVVCICMLLTFNMSLWDYSVNFSPNWSLTRKRLIVERNEQKIVLLGMSVGVFDLEHAA